MRIKGNLPSGWKNDKLGSLCTKLTDGTHKTPDYKTSGVIFISAKNVRNGQLDFSDHKYISYEEHAFLTRRCKPEAGDVMLSKSGSLGDSVVVPKLDFEFSIFESLALIKVKKMQISPKYLMQILNSPLAKRYFWSITTGLAVKHLHLGDLKKMPILHPFLSEQNAITDLLSTWDEAIVKTERLIQAKEKQLDAYARDLFDRKNDGKYEGWKVVKLKTVLTEHCDKSTGAEEVFSVSVHKGLVNQVEHLGRSFSAANTDNYNRVHYGDIVYTKSPTGDFPLGIVKQSYAKEDVIVSPLYGVFAPRTFNLGIVLDFYFSSPARARNYLFPIVQKGAKNTIAITNKTFLSKALHLPVDEKAQKAVAEFVYAAREEIDLLKQLADKYKTQKRGMMQKMLTGEWRVKPEIVNQYMEA